MSTALQIRTFSEVEVTKIINEARALERYDLTRLASREISDHLIAEGGVGEEGNPLSVVYRAATNVGVAREYVDLALQNQRSIEDLRRLERNLKSKFTPEQLRTALDPLLIQVVRGELPGQLIRVKRTKETLWFFNEDDFVASKMVFYRRDPILSEDRTLAHWLTRTRYRDMKIFEFENKYAPRFGSPEFDCTIFDPDYLEVLGSVREKFGSIIRKRLSIYETKLKVECDYPIALNV
ncbi:hypothetical protein HOD38_02970 [archaeon]|jgi:hypothetical protein|nr:hypothetical protein [archaeon]MBT4397203.1 hypothetical protein [archaeon]MBT4440583.1 hypothetical protein [archaeon]